MSATLKSVRDIGNFDILVVAFQEEYLFQHREMGGRYILYCNGEFIDESDAWDINRVHYDLGFRMPDGTAKPTSLSAARSYTWTLRKKIQISMTFDGKSILDYEGHH